ncbi:MAG: TauD/TfdA family dioxygenase [Rhodospirillaceae bacterium]|jgi:hypothetical protein
MPFKPAPRIRKHAKPLEPLVDPAGWTADELAASDDWIYELSEAEQADICKAVSHIEREGVPILDITRENFPLPEFDKGLAALYDELLEGRGFFLIRDVPVEGFTKEQAAIAFWGIGTRLGRTVSQNTKGHMLGHVKALGQDYEDQLARGYQTADEMHFHSDMCDYVALMCLHPSKSGGASRIASSVTLYNELLKLNADFVEDLVKDFYFTKYNESKDGKPSWYTMPVFSFQDGYFSSKGIGSRIMKAQNIPDVPKFTELRQQAVAAYLDKVNEIYFDMDFLPGDIQVLHNHVMLHSRTAFEDWPESDRKRHLIRLWLCDDHGRPTASGFRDELRGIVIHDVEPSAPLDNFEPV